jgi:hypothetical protein
MGFGPMADSPISRRSVFIAAAAAAGAGLVGASPASAASGALPGPDDPAQGLANFLKLTSDLSGRPVYGWQQGLLYGVTPGQMARPLLGLVGFGCGSVHKQADGTYQSLWKEVLFYTDLVSGEILDTWTNPYTGDTCEILHVHNRSVNFLLSPHLPDYAALEQKTGMSLGYSSTQTETLPGHPYYLQSAVIGDQVTLFSDARGYVPNKLDPKIWKRESTGDHISVAEFYTNSGSLSALLDPAITSVPSTGQWNRIGPWLPWMLMGGHAGEVFYSCTTKKLRSADELPHKLAAYTAKNYPEFLVPPTDFNVPMESSWEVFKRERKPAPPR